MLNRSETRARPLQYRHGNSFLHRRGALAKLIVAMMLGGWALWLDALPALIALLGVVLSGYAWAGLSRADVWRDLRWLVLQALLLTGMTVALHGLDAFGAGVRSALQITIVFLPIALVVRTTGMTAMLDDLRGRLPERSAFAAGATLRFIPFFARELGELVEMQRLRGAHLSARDLARPRAWRDWLACVALPMTVRAIEISEEAADAASIRGIGITGRDPAKETT